MSVIYKALSTIDAAEGSRHVYPGVADPAAACRGSGGHGGKMLLAAVVLIGAGGAAVMVAEPGLLRSRAAVSAGAPPAPTARAEPGVQSVPPDSGQPDGGAIADAASPGAGPDRAETEPEPAGQAQLVFEPATTGSAPDAAEVTAVAVIAGDTNAADTGGTPGPTGPAPAAMPAARETATRTDTSPPVSDPPIAVERDTEHDFPAVNTDHTRRVRLLNADLQRALKNRDTDGIARLLNEMERLVGPDSSYMLKMRAFTQLTLGGDTEHAMRLLREVLVRDPGDEDAVLNMAVAEIGMGEVAEARRRLEALAVAHPGDDRIDKLLRSLQ